MTDAYRRSWSSGGGNAEIGERLERDVSRILFPRSAGGGYLSVLPVARELKRPTHPKGRAIPLRGSFGLAPDGVCPAPRVAAGTVSSYLAISPLPEESRLSPWAVCFLWHFPPVARSRR